MELRAVTAGYGGADVVKGISLRFQPGEVTVLAGPNGCGKSTLLRAAARLLPLRGGQVLVDGGAAGHLPGRRPCCPSPGLCRRSP